MSGAETVVISLLLGLIILAGIIFGVFLFLYKKTNREKKNIQELLNENSSQFANYKEQTEHLKQYEAIDDAKIEAERIVSNAQKTLYRVNAEYNKKIEEGQQLGNAELKEARQKASSLKEQAEAKLAESYKMAKRIEEGAKKEAEKIAGEAWEAKEKADQYTATVKAMNNIIKGYGDDYLIPATTLLDVLAAEYDHKEAARELEMTRKLLVSMIKSGEAADCDYVEQYRKNTAIEFVLDAFNGKVDSIMSKIKHDNYGKMLQQIEDAYRIVNHNGQAFRSARITPQYYEIVVQRLKHAVTVQEIRKKDIEEQKRIKQEMREEEAARRDFEKAKKQAENEGKVIQKALKEAEERLASAATEEKLELEQQLAELSQKLAEAEAKGQRAISMAQQTKQGHVYIISNIGSFGDNVYKIGLTRRLEPYDRVKELGDASVPFSFDVHAMIHSEDAPKLEKVLHEVFEKYQVNKVNIRKEFFRVPITEIKTQVDNIGSSSEVHWTMKAEAIEYRETLQLEKEDLIPG